MPSFHYRLPDGQNRFAGRLRLSEYHQVRSNQQLYDSTISAAAEMQLENLLKYGNLWGFLEF